MASTVMASGLPFSSGLLAEMYLSPPKKKLRHLPKKNMILDDGLIFYPPMRPIVLT